MRKVIVATCCAAFLGSISIASAQTAAPSGQTSMKTTSPMESYAKTTKKKTKKHKARKTEETTNGATAK